MKLLICSLNYAPELTATGRYTGEMAEWLATQGHNVDAITAPPHYPEWEVPAKYRDKSFYKEELNSVTVHRVPCYIPPLHKLNALQRIFMECSFTLLSLIYCLKILLQRDKYDIVIAICPPM